MHYIQPKLSPIGAPTKARKITKPPPGLTQQSLFEDFFNDKPYFDQCQQQNPFMMGTSDMTMSTTMPTELMNQMMNSYQQQPQNQQKRFNPMNPFADMPQSNQSYYERNLKFQQQQQLAALKRDFFNSSGIGSMGGSSASSSMSAYENSMHQYSMMATPSNSFYRYDPPKPDTPPSKPLWLDPVWNSDGHFFDNRSSGLNSGNYGNSDAVSDFFIA